MWKSFRRFESKLFARNLFSRLSTISKSNFSWDHLVPEEKSFFGGSWQGAQSGKTFTVSNPATGEHLRSVPATSTSEAEISIESAFKCQKLWASLPPDERATAIRKWANAIRQNIDPLAALITAENGKPLADARTEVMSGVTALEWYAEECKRVFGYTVPSLRSKFRQQLVIHQPVGIVGVITPWNFPISMITRKVGAALAAGCAVILKPAEDTPLSALAITYLGIKEAGIPTGLLNTLTASGDHTGAEQIANVLCSDPRIRLIGFTGSTKVGRTLYTKAANYNKRVLLEMGGNAPFIIFDSSIIDRAVAGLIACKFRCSGQTCISANRIFVQDNIHDEFVKKLCEAVNHLVTGDGSRSGVHLGPVINESALNKIENLVIDAKHKGARAMIGGQGRLTGLDSFGLDYSKGYFYPATVLVDCHPEMSCMEQEIFGPVACVCRFKTEEEVIEMANQTPFGLAGYIYTENINEAWRTAEKLQVGMVGLNAGLVSTVELPFGGVKDSGIGREGGPHALLEFMDTKSLSWDVSGN